MSDENDNCGDTGVDDDDIPDEPIEVIEVDDFDFENDDLAVGVDGVDLENDDEEDPDMQAEGGDNVRDDSSLVFPEHKDSVFCVKLCNGMAITGGQDDKALVWNTSSAETLLECKGHKDSVTNVGFSHDGVYAASADLSGLVKVWKIESKSEAWSFECSDIEWLQWHQMAHVLLVGTTDGDSWMWKIPSGDTKTFQGHGCTTGSGQLLPDGKRLSVGYDDGALKIWDLKNASCLQNIAGSDGHKSPIVSMDCHSDNNLILTASTDCTSKVIHSQTGKVLSTFDCRDKSDEENSVETCGFCHVQALAATGTLAGKLHIWDIAAQTSRSVCEHPAGIVKLKWDSVSPMVYTACLDGALRLWDARNGECVSSWTGHEDSILDFDISRDGNTLVSVSDDHTARVYSLHMPDR